jgi:hypothetical protein
MASLSAALTVFLCCIALCGQIVCSSDSSQSNSEERDSGGGYLSSGSGSGFASGSASGDFDEDEVLREGEAAECVDEMPRETDEGENNMTSSTAFTAGSCSLLCMENVTSNPLHKGAGLETRTIGGAWMFQFFPQFSQKNEKRNCPVYQEYAECVRGCLVRVDPDSAGLKRNHCKRECKADCEGELETDNHYFNPFCPIDCNASICRQGCDNYENIVRSSNTQGSPPGPVSAPELVSSSLNGQVLFNISHSFPEANEQGHPLTSVGLVFRVRDQSTNITKYFFKEDPEEPLSLSEFACRPVSISFMVFNRFGASQESPPLSFMVPGGVITVRAPKNLKAVSGVDKRPGFFGHAVLTISWNHPEGYREGLNYYTVKVSVFNHPDIYTSPLLSSNSLTVADSEGESVLLLGRHVLYQVCSLFGDKQECNEENHDLGLFSELEGNVVRITDCVPHWTGSLFNFILFWTVPEYVAYGSGIFSSFQVVADEKRSKRFINNFHIPKTPNQTMYFYTWPDLPPLESEEDYEFRVSIQWKDSSDYTKPNVMDATCSVKAVPPPSSPVLDVALSDLQYTVDDIQFEVQWSPPATTNDRLTHYLACLGGRRLRQFEEVPATPSDGNDTTCVQIEAERSFTWKYRAPRPDCIYFQMRAHTELGGGGEWSEAVIISHGSITPDHTCESTPTLKAAAAALKSDRPSSSYATGLIAVGALAVLLVAVSLSIVTVVCGRIRRRKRKLRHVLARQVCVPHHLGQKEREEHN